MAKITIGYTLRTRTLDFGADRQSPFLKVDPNVFFIHGKDCVVHEYVPEDLTALNEMRGRAYCGRDTLTSLVNFAVGHHRGDTYHEIIPDVLPQRLTITINTEPFESAEPENSFWKKLLNKFRKKDSLALVRRS